MPLIVHGILADANCAGHLALLLQLLQVGWRHDVWEELHLRQDNRTTTTRQACPHRRTPMKAVRLPHSHEKSMVYRDLACQMRSSIAI